MSAGDQPAFPLNVYLQDQGTYLHKTLPGILKREYYAAHASEEDIRWAAQDYMDKTKKDLCNRWTARFHHADLMISAESQP